MPGYVLVLGLAAAVYVVNLTVSGYANTYYSMAAQAASQSWSAWFFGSLDAANFITTDKPPLSTMLIGLSVRLFGLSSWSVLLPQALAGIATVALLYSTVRRTFGPAAATAAGLVCALTPAAVLMFRYNNPDAILTLLLVGAACSLVRGLESGRLRWVITAGVLVGLAFNTKFLQAYLVLPAFALTYVVAAPGSLGRRLVGLVAALAAVVVSSGWWVAAVELIPASMRPYIGGSNTNSALELLLGYDGLGRIFGMGGGGFGGGAGGSGFSGEPGLFRLFNAEFGGQIGWLLPFALVGLVAGIALRGRAPRTDLRRAAYLLWGGWLLVHALVFSFMSGIVHTYYAVAMAPAVGALVGGGAVDLWSARARPGRVGVVAGLALAATLLGSSIWAAQLLARTPSFAPGLSVLVVVLGTLAAVAVAVPASGAGNERARPIRRMTLGAAALGMAALLIGPGVYALDTMATAYSGGDPQAGPAVAGSRGGPGNGRGIGNGAPPTAPNVTNPAIGPIGGTRPAPGAGGFAGGSAVSDELVAFLVANRGSATWLVAVTSSNEAATIQLATGRPVMTMGGFSGGDPALTVEGLEAYVANGQLRYIMVGGQGAPGGGSSEITSWVTANGTLVEDVGDGSLYDLAAGV